METGLSYTSRLTVTDENTATHMGSGDLPVLATPSLVALMENAALNAVASLLPEGCTTVGGYIQTSHIRPTGPGHTVQATATLTSVEGHKLTFDIEAHDEKGLVGEGKHIRFIIDRERFLKKIQ